MQSARLKLSKPLIEELVAAALVEQVNREENSQYGDRQPFWHDVGPTKPQPSIRLAVRRLQSTGAAVDIVIHGSLSRRGLVTAVVRPMTLGRGGLSREKWLDSEATNSSRSTASINCPRV